MYHMQKIWHQKFTFSLATLHCRWVTENWAHKREVYTLPSAHRKQNHFTYNKNSKPKSDSWNGRQAAILLAT